MEAINRQAYGYRSFENYRQRVLMVSVLTILGIGVAPGIDVEPKTTANE
jgi:hypothetical protein